MFSLEWLMKILLDEIVLGLSSCLEFNIVCVHQLDKFPRKAEVEWSESYDSVVWSMVYFARSNISFHSRFIRLWPLAHDIALIAVIWLVITVIVHLVGRSIAHNKGLSKPKINKLLWVREPAFSTMGTEQTEAAAPELEFLSIIIAYYQDMKGL